MLPQYRWSAKAVVIPILLLVVAELAEIDAAEAVSSAEAKVSWRDLENDSAPTMDDLLSSMNDDERLGAAKSSRVSGNSVDSELERQKRKLEHAKKKVGALRRVKSLRTKISTKLNVAEESKADAKANLKVAEDQVQKLSMQKKQTTATAKEGKNVQSLKAQQSKKAAARARKKTLALQRKLAQAKRHLAAQTDKVEKESKQSQVAMQKAEAKRDATRKRAEAAQAKQRKASRKDEHARNEANRALRQTAKAQKAALVARMTDKQAKLTKQLAEKDEHSAAKSKRALKREVRKDKGTLRAARKDVSGAQRVGRIAERKKVQAMRVERKAARETKKEEANKISADNALKKLHAAVQKETRKYRNEKRATKHAVNKIVGFGASCESQKRISVVPGIKNNGGSRRTIVRRGNFPG
jgi:hypothetical protein